MYIPADSIHTGDITLESGQTLYFAGGAILKGCVYVDNTTDTKILGRGIIYQPSYDAVSAKFARKVTLDGIIAVNYGYDNSGRCAFRCGQSTNVTIRNYKAFEKNRWGDGIAVFLFDSRTD
ncbi:MAG: hypothetical protein PHH37_14230 [Paludibacter sp.]|nr:hypothetical protein [Paludibacter sp.]